jgi:hypothetical protein
MPMMISSYGYALWLDTTYRTDWQISDTEAIFTTESSQNILNLFYGGYAIDSLTEMAAEVGISLIPPMYSFGLWEQFSNE